MMTMKPPPKEITTQMAVASVLVALTDVLLTIRETQAEIEQQLKVLRECSGSADDIYREARKLSAICETAKRDIGR